MHHIWSQEVISNHNTYYIWQLLSLLTLSWVLFNVLDDISLELFTSLFIFISIFLALLTLLESSYWFFTFFALKISIFQSVHPAIQHALFLEWCYCWSKMWWSSLGFSDKIGEVCMADLLFPIHLSINFHRGLCFGKSVEHFFYIHCISSHDNYKYCLSTDLACNYILTHSINN